MTRRLRLAVAAAMTIFVAGCDPAGPGEPIPDPGPVNVVLATPRDDDGAVMFSIRGGALDSISAVGYGAFATQTAADAHRVIVSGDIVDGPIARIWLPDRRALAPYTLGIEQVANRVTYAQQPATGYALSLELP
jgi:hypothetical protein